MARPNGDGTVLSEARDGRVLDDARALFDAYRWRQCVDRLADGEPLDGEGLLLLGRAAHLIGADERAAAAFARA